MLDYFVWIGKMLEFRVYVNFNLFTSKWSSVYIFAMWMLFRLDLSPIGSLELEITQWVDVVYLYTKCLMKRMNEFSLFFVV